MEPVQKEYEESVKRVQSVCRESVERVLREV